MKQIVQDIRRGGLRFLDLPAPKPGPGEVLIANAVSLISPGTEKSLRETAKKSLLAKARERPDQVKRVLEKVRQEGVLTAARQVLTRLHEAMPLGYCSAGRVLACGPEVAGLKPGDRVASNGPHASLVTVPKHLCALVPDGVGFDSSAFTVLGAIALQGVRLARVGLGDRVFVIGLGLVGQITVGLLKAAGCEVIGTDLDEAKCRLALTLGARVAATGVDAGAVQDFTGGLGADAVLLTASTPSNQPIELAGKSVRKKGRVVAVGLVGLDVPRRDFYFKEAELVVSCSYGPGRYDPSYEERGRDYPAAYVRWTEQRNMEAVLALMAAGTLDVSPLVSHRFAIDDAERAYDLVESGTEPYLGILLEYPEVGDADIPRTLPSRKPSPGKGPALGFVGAGSFARGVLLPAVAREPAVRLRTVCTGGGRSAVEAAERFGFEQATADESAIYSDPEIGAVVIATRHGLHARQVVAGLRAGKHVFVEKPLALSVAELEEIEDELRRQGSGRPLLQVGFNRRFSPAAARARAAFEAVRGPLAVLIRANAGTLPGDHWVQDAAEGGGRIVGEACHFIDLATYLTGSVPVRVFAESVGGVHAPEITDDRVLITLRHANGSISSIAYFAGGDRALPKERIEVFGGERSAVIDDFRAVEIYAGGRRKRRRFREQDKGHQAEIAAFLRAVQDGTEGPIAWSDLKAVSLASLLAVESLREGLPMELAG